PFTGWVLASPRAACTVKCSPRTSQTSHAAGVPFQKAVPFVTTPSAGLYIHFPYCVSICNYCDFDRQATGFSSIPRYVAAVVAEIGMQRRRPIHSVFFGGGTPSLMSADQVTAILGAAG